jgi:hypothetical protein
MRPLDFLFSNQSDISFAAERRVYPIPAESFPVKIGSVQGAKLVCGVILFLVLCFCFPAFGDVNVLTYHNNNSRNGENLNETILTPSNVNQNTFGKLFSHALDGYVWAQPLYVSGVNIPGQGLHNVVFVATQHDSVYAFDADSNTGANGGLLWQVSLGTSAVTPSPDFGNRYGDYSDISPEVGITGTPVIDLASGTLYVDAFTHEGSAYYHRLHALNITNGVERAFSPVLVSVSVPGSGVGGSGGTVTFNPQQQLQKSALTLANGVLYVNFAGFADTDPYHGWIIGYDPATLQQLPGYLFNSTPNATVAVFGQYAGEGGIWMGGGGLVEDADHSLFVATGNGSFNALNNAGGTEYGDSIIRFSTTSSLVVTDYFTPFDQQFLADNDLDLGSGGVMLLPDQPGPYPHLLVGCGKEGTIYVVNRDMMTTGNNHYNNGGNDDAVLQTFSLTSGSFSTPAYFNGTLYYVGVGQGMKAFSITNGTFDIFPTSTGPRTFGFPGATPSISANGSDNGIVWALQNAAPAVLAAYDATDLSSEIYDSTQAPGNRDQLANAVKFVVPTVANGKVYVGGQSSLAVFGLFAGSLQFSSSTYTVGESAGVATITVSRTGGSKGAVQVNYATVAGGTAVVGSDYNTASGTLSWADGDSSSKTFDVTILDDHEAEPNQTVNLALSDPTGASLGAQSTAVLTILEDPFDAWKFAHFGANANNPLIAGDLADPDGDRIVNVLEYAFGSDPNQAATGNPFGGGIVGNHFQMNFPRNIFATDLTFIAQATSSLQSSWTDVVTWASATGWTTNLAGAGIVESAPSGPPSEQHVNVTVTDPSPASTGNRFFRLKVHW